MEGEMPSLLHKWKDKRRTIGATSPHLASLESLSGENGRSLGEDLDIALDRFFETPDEDQEGKIKPTP